MRVGTKGRQTNAPRLATMSDDPQSAFAIRAKMTMGLHHLIGVTRRTVEGEAAAYPLVSIPAFRAVNYIGEVRYVKLGTTRLVKPKPRPETFFKHGVKSGGTSTPSK